MAANEQKKTFMNLAKRVIKLEVRITRLSKNQPKKVSKRQTYKAGKFVAEANIE